MNPLYKQKTIIYVCITILIVSWSQVKAVKFSKFIETDMYNVAVNYVYC